MHCTQCSHVVTANDKFCAKCGHPVGGTPRAANAPSRSIGNAESANLTRCGAPRASNHG